MAGRDPGMPEGYKHTPSSSAFVNHVGRAHHRYAVRPDGTEEVWIALRIEPHHVNTWNFGHGGLIAAMAEFANSGPSYEKGKPPVVIAQMSISFIRAPKLGDLLEAHGFVLRRTKSMAFTRVEARVGADLIFTADAVHKVVGAV
jgi:acyl-coenzyme A thioesterase PaaI-like protein